MIEGNQITFEDVCTLLGFRQIELCSADNYFVPVINKMIDKLLQVQRFGTAFYERHVVDTES